MMAAGHPHCYVATASVGYPIDLMNKVRKGLNHKGAAFLMVYTPCQKGFVYETPRSIDLGRLVVECGLYPMWEWNPEKREYDYSFRPQSMRPVSEYLKLQGRFGHLHAEHIATAEVRQPAMADDGCRAARSLDPGGRCEERNRHGGGGRSRGGGGNRMNTTANIPASKTVPEVEPEGQESYIVSEGKKRGSTRDVRPDAAYDRYYTVLRVHPGDAILTDNWHTNEVLSHARATTSRGHLCDAHARGVGSDVENDHRAYYTAGGRIWVMDLEPAKARSRECPVPAELKDSGRLSRILLIDDTPEIAELLTFALRDAGHEVFASGYTASVNDLLTSTAPMRLCSIAPPTK